MFGPVNGGRRPCLIGLRAHPNSFGAIMSGRAMALPDRLSLTAIWLGNNTLEKTGAFASPGWKAVGEVTPPARQ